MAEGERVKPALKVISQKQFMGLYISTLDDPIYRPLVNDQRHFRINKLLQDYGYAPDLSGLNLRNLNFRCADFGGIKLERTDFRGASCNWADFSNAIFDQILTDEVTGLYEAQFIEHQLHQLTLPENVLANVKVNQSV